MREGGNCSLYLSAFEKLHIDCRGSAYILYLMHSFANPSSKCIFKCRDLRTKTRTILCPKFFEEISIIN